MSARTRSSETPAMRANACASGFWARAITLGAGIPMSRTIQTRRL